MALINQIWLPEAPMMLNPAPIPVVLLAANWRTFPPVVQLKILKLRVTPALAMVEVCEALLKTTVVLEAVNPVRLKSPPTVMVWLLVAVKVALLAMLRVICLPTVRANVLKASVPAPEFEMVRLLLTCSALSAVPPVLRVRL